ncbi:MAG TPA: serine/threonine-protein kinase, partial [Acidimicrobiales bacterium]|nr:serine/threonine-protein kinase [Acidimicrobiales bacterium]
MEPDRWSVPLVKWARLVGRKHGRHHALSPRFPGYSNVAEIATGPFATVYRALELGTSRPVALKVLHLSGNSASAVEPFHEELATLSLLSKHPNVVTLYRSFFTAEGRPVLVMELCRESYGQRAAQRGPLAPAEVVAAGIKVAGALETAHRAGVLHRDVKPQNILLSEPGEPVVADFGLVGLQTLGQSTERLAGTATLHAAPEALEGAALSPATDVYGLASSVYELVVGRGPFVTYKGEEPASVILRVVRDPAPRPPLSAMPIALADLLESALAKDPLSRPQSVASFAESLRKIEAGAGWPETQYVVWEAAQLAAPRPGVAGAMARAGLK